MGVCVHIYMIYFEELAIPYYKFLCNMEAEKFPDLRSASWRPERTDVVHSSPKAEDQCLSRRESEFSLPPPFLLFGPSVGWMEIQ